MTRGSSDAAPLLIVKKAIKEVREMAKKEKDE